MKRLMLALACVAASSLIVGGIAATGAPPNPKKMTVCHWTGKKYVKVNVGARSFEAHMRHGPDLIPAPATCPTQQLSSLRTGGRPLRTSLTGAAEVPGPGDPDGRGTALIRLNRGQGKVCFLLRVSNITLPAIGAHIHAGTRTESGGVVVALTPPDATGVSFGCVSATRTLIDAIRTTPSNYYVNVHTTDFTDGAIRGQL